MLAMGLFGSPTWVPRYEVMPVPGITESLQFSPKWRFTFLHFLLQLLVFSLYTKQSLHLNLHEYFEWESAPIVIAKYLTPLQHVLLMEFLCGSVEAFFTMKMDGIRYNCPGI